MDQCHKKVVARMESWEMSLGLVTTDFDLLDLRFRELLKFLTVRCGYDATFFAI